MLTPKSFGAIADGKTDDTQALNEFFAHIADNEIYDVRISGTYLITDTVYFQPTKGNQIKSLEINGSPTFICRGDFDIGFRIHGFAWGYWNGIINVKGQGSSTWASRKQHILVYVTSSGRSKFLGFKLDGAKYSGLFIDGDRGNTSHMSLGKVRGSGCGSGSINKNASLYANVLKVENNGTEMFLDKLPPILQDVNGNTIGRSMIMFKVVGEDYMGYARYGYDLDKSKLIMKGDHSHLEGKQIVFFHGGVISIKGSDAGVMTVESIDAVNSTCAMDVMSMYGHTVGATLSQSCGTSFILGNRLDGAMVTMTMQAPYVEGVYYEIVRLSAAVSDGSFTIIGEYAFNINKCYSFSGDKRNMSGIAFIKSGQFYSYYADPRTKHSRMDISANSTKHVSYKKDFWTFGVSYSKTLYDAYGYHNSFLTVYGSGENNAPKGSLKFIKPKKSEYGKDITINGEANECEFKDFQGVAKFMLVYNGDKNIDIIEL